MSQYVRVAPPAVIDAVEDYVTAELEAARRYDNREPFDQSGVYDLHTLVADAYARGWSDGEQAQRHRDNGQRRRDRAAEPA